MFGPLVTISEPPHALRNRGMCDIFSASPAPADEVRLTLFETAGCATAGLLWVLSRVTVRLTLFETAGCATVLGSWLVLTRVRLTLFETAGCATERRRDEHVVDVDPPHALRNRGMCDYHPPRAGREVCSASRSSKPRDVRRRRWRTIPARGSIPPHALRNRGMCDTCTVHSPGGLGPPHALRNRGMCDGRVTS